MYFRGKKRRKNFNLTSKNGLSSIWERLPRHRFSPDPRLSVTKLIFSFPLLELFSLSTGIFSSLAVFNANPTLLFCCRIFSSNLLEFDLKVNGSLNSNQFFFYFEFLNFVFSQDFGFHLYFFEL